MTERSVPDAERRRRRAAIAGHQGDEATARELVDDPDPAVRSAALGALHRLGLFAVGYATMAKHITSTGAFYGYISHGLGRVIGMASGLATSQRNTLALIRPPR